MPSKLVETREKFDQVQGLIGQALKQAGEQTDFSAIDVFGADMSSADNVEKFRDANRQLDDLATEIKGLEAAEKARTALYEFAEQRSRPAEAPHAHSAPSFGARSQQSFKSIGERLVASSEYEEYRQEHTKGFSVLFDDMELKTLMATYAGWAPEPDRTGRVVEMPVRPIQILDYIPMADTESNAITYWEEVVRTNNAVETAEAATYAEDAFELAERLLPVRKITTSLPVTDEQLQDRPAVRSLIDQKLGFNLRQRLDSQVINGDGAGVNLRGILNYGGIQTQAKGGDPTFDAVHKAATKVRTVGRALPTALVMHSNDWETIRLTRTADGIYIMGNPSQMGATTLFGIPVVQNEAIPENTALIGDFANFSRLYDRRGVVLEVGYVGDQFKQGKKTIRADLRVAFVVERPSAFVQITGI